MMLRRKPVQEQEKEEELEMYHRWTNFDGAVSR